MKNFSSRNSDPSLPYGRGWGWVFFSLLSLLFSCQSSPTISPEEEARRDSAALHVALMPVDDCIPFYYAQRTGIYDSLGLDLRIKTLQAQLDTDTALMHGRSHLVYSDLVRAIMMQQDTTRLRAVASTDGELQFITANHTRIRQLFQLHEHMVAVARHSITDYWSDRLTDSAQMARADIFRPQINDVRIRTDMLCNGTMDAAFLPEPYAQEAALRGNTIHFSTAGQGPRLTAFVAPEGVLADSSRCAQLQLLFKGYSEAVRRLNDHMKTDTLAVLYKELCQMPDTLIDTLIITHKPFTVLRTPQHSDAETALQWLRTRSKAREGYTTDSLIHEFPL